VTIPSVHRRSRGETTPRAGISRRPEPAPASTPRSGSGCRPHCSETSQLSARLILSDPSRLDVSPAYDPTHAADETDPVVGINGYAHYAPDQRRKPAKRPRRRPSPRWRETPLEIPETPRVAPTASSRFATESLQSLYCRKCRPP
jgi:hypothetical protein